MATLTQGGAQGSCLALALGYNRPPRWGSTRKRRLPAASQLSNLQVKPLACRGSLGAQIFIARSVKTNRRS